MNTSEIVDEVRGKGARGNLLSSKTFKVRSNSSWMGEHTFLSNTVRHDDIIGFLSTEVSFDNDRTYDTCQRSASLCQCHGAKIPNTARTEFHEFKEETNERR